MDPQVVLNRIMRLVRLDTTVFDEVRDDQRELIPAVIIVALSALIAGIGTWLLLMFDAPEGVDIDFGKVFVNIWLLGTIFVVVLWGVWVAVTYVVLVQFYKEQADLQALLRTMGYASFPFALSLVVLIPWFGIGIGVAALTFWFVMSIYAVQSCTTASSDRVIMANGIGFIVFLAILTAIAHESGMGTSIFVQPYHALVEGEFWKSSL